MSMYRCPGCGHEDEMVRYEVPVIEYGTYHIDDDEYDRDGEDGADGDTIYRCRECDHEYRLCEFICVEDEEEKEERPDLVETNKDFRSPFYRKQRMAIDSESRKLNNQIQFCDKCQDLFLKAKFNETRCEACSLS